MRTTNKSERDVAVHLGITIWGQEWQIYLINSRRLDFGAQNFFSRAESVFNYSELKLPSPLFGLFLFFKINCI